MEKKTLTKREMRRYVRDINEAVGMLDGMMAGMHIIRGFRREAILSAILHLGCRLALAVYKTKAEALAELSLWPE